MICAISKNFHFDATVESALSKIEGLRSSAFQRLRKRSNDINEPAGISHGISSYSMDSSATI
jgi:hypothetical protein